MSCGALAVLALLAAPARAQTGAPPELKPLPLAEALREGVFAEGVRIGTTSVQDLRGLFVSGRFELRPEPETGTAVLTLLNEDERSRYGYSSLEFLFADARGRRSLGREAVLRQVVVPVDLTPEQMVRRFGREFLILQAPPRAAGETAWRVYFYPQNRLYLFYDGVKTPGLAWYVEGVRENPDMPQHDLRNIRKLLVGDVPEVRAQMGTSSRPSRSYTALSWADSYLAFDDSPGFKDKDARYYLLLGRAWEAKGESGRALESLGEGMELFGDDPWLPFAAGEIERKGGKVDDALASFRRATELGFPEGLAFHRLAQLLAKTGRRDEALKAYDQALMRYPLLERGLRGQVLTEKGLLLFKAKRLEEFVAAQKEARRTDPNVLLPHFQLGEALAKLGRLEEAAAEYDAARRLSPKTSVVYWNLGVILEELKRDREALRFWEDFLDLSNAPEHLAEARRRVARLRSALPAPRPAFTPGSWARLRGAASETWLVPALSSGVAVSTSGAALSVIVERPAWTVRASTAAPALSTAPVAFDMLVPLSPPDPEGVSVQVIRDGRPGGFQSVGRFLEETGAVPEGRFGDEQEAAGQDEALAGLEARVADAAQELSDKADVSTTSAAAALRVAALSPSPWFLATSAPAEGPAALSWRPTVLGLENVSAPFGRLWTVRVRQTLERLEEVERRRYKVIHLIVDRWVSPAAPGAGFVREVRRREEANEVHEPPNEVRETEERLRGDFTPVSESSLELAEWGEKK